MIGERGVRLRARAAAYRDCARNSEKRPILILDEATSALDTIGVLSNRTAKFDDWRTVFVIAHRLSTVRRADRIVVLENGTISDIGATKNDAKLGTYRRLYELQFAEA